MNTLLYTLVQVICGSFCLFFLTAFLVEVALALFKIRNPRARSFFRLLPIVRLPLELGLALLFHQIPFLNLNLLSCVGPLKKLLSYLQFDYVWVNVKKSLSEVFSDHLSLAMTLLIAFIIIALFKLFSCIRSLWFVETLYLSTELCNRKVENNQLQHALQQNGVTIVTCSNLETPAALKKDSIAFPENIVASLSQAEFEAVVAHEFEHLRWLDPYMKLIYTVVSHVFWWIPMRHWGKRLEEEQENASDASIHRFGFEGISLADALVKVVKRRKYSGCLKGAACQLNPRRSDLFKRIEKILTPIKLTENHWKIGLSAVLIASMSFLLGFSIC